MRVFIFLFVFFSVHFIYGESVQTSYIEVILDASNSMNEVINGEKKMDTAKRVLSNLVEQWETESTGNIHIGLRVYGNNFDPTKTKEIACQDTTLEVPISKNSAGDIKSKIYGIEAKGYTPIAYTLNEAIGDFTPGNVNSVVLVSDGKESCDGNPCDVAKAYKENGLELKIHVIGFAVDDETQAQLKCIADATGGKYYTAGNAEDLKMVAEKVKLLVSEEIAPPKSSNKKIKLSGPGKFTLQVPENIPGIPLSEVSVHKAGEDKHVVSFWKDYYTPKMLASGQYDLWIKHKGSGDWFQYMKNFTLKSKESKIILLDTGLIFVTDDEDLKASIDRIFFNTLPDDKKYYSIWDKKHMFSPKPLAPGKYKIYIQYKGSRDPTPVIEEIELAKGDFIEIEI